MILTTDMFKPISISPDQPMEIVDVFSISGQKTITLQSHSSLIYLVVVSGANVDIQIVTKGPQCSCKIFGLFSSDTQHPVDGSLNVSLDHSQTSAEVELISFLHDGAQIAIDGTIDIGKHLDHIHGRLLQQNIILGKDISIKTLPKLNIASHNVRASHGATIDTLDQQKLFYMMSRGLTKEQSQKLLVDGYIEYVLSHFDAIDDSDKMNIHTILTRY